MSLWHQGNQAEKENIISPYLGEHVSVLPAVLPELHRSLRGRHQADAGDLPVGEGEDGGQVAGSRGELGERHRGVPEIFSTAEIFLTAESFLTTEIFLIAEILSTAEIF